MYEVKPVDLAAAFVEREIAAPSKRISEIVIFSFPAGAEFQMKIGARNEWFTVTEKFSSEPRGEDEANSGLYVRNVLAQAGVIVEVIVVYGELSPVV